jgi:serine/threonine-protein kinase
VPTDKPWLEAAARAVADGEPIDWNDLPADRAGQDQATLAHLRLIAHIADVHRSASMLPATESKSQDGDPTMRAATWGPFTLGERVGGGAYGDVYRARDVRLDRDVALKLLRAGSVSAQGVVEEARLLARIRHPHVVTVFGADVHDGRVGLWMEFIHGRSLEREIAESGRLTAVEAARVGIDVCNALTAVHAAGLIHRDVKAANILREGGGRIVLMDFGAGCEDAGDGDATARGAAGTPLYLAPEVLKGEPASPRSDLYSVGVVLYHLVTGDYPTTGRTLEDLRGGLNERNHLDETRQGLPPAFVNVVECALAHAPDDRFESAREMESALAAAIADQDTALPRRSAVRGRAKRLSGWGVGAVFMTAGVGAIMSLGAPPATATWEEPVARDVRSLSASTPRYPVTLSVASASPAAHPRAPIRPRVSAAAPPVERVTTTSAQARRLYEQSLAAYRSKPGEALLLAHEAVKEDTRFASGHAWVAYLLLEQNKRDEARAAVERAATRAAGATIAERLFIDALAKDVAGARQEAMVAWETYIRLRPDDRRALDRLLGPLLMAGREEDVFRFYAKAARLLPDDFFANMDAAWYGMAYGARLRDIQPFLARTRALLTPDVPPSLAAWVLLEPVFEDWLHGDASTAVGRLDESARSENHDETFLYALANMNLAFGRLRAAEAALGRLPLEASLPVWLARAEIAALREDAAGVRAALDSAPQLKLPPAIAVNRVTTLLVRVGMLDDVDKWLDAQPDQIKKTNAAFAAAEGELALARGDVPRAVERLSGWQQTVRGSPAQCIAATTYALALERKGDWAAAVSVLETLGAQRIYLYARPQSPIPAWLRSRPVLARLYRALGRQADAEATEADLRRLLAFADADLRLQK